MSCINMPAFGGPTYDQGELDSEQEQDRRLQ